MSVTDSHDPPEPPAEPPFVSDRQRAGWGSDGQPRYDRRVEERRRVAPDDPEAIPDRRADLRRADDRWDANRPASADFDPAPLRLTPVTPGIPAAEPAAGAGRLLALILVIAIAFAGGVAVDQAAWRGPASAPAPVTTSVPLATSAVRPPTTSQPGTSAAPSGASATVAPGSTATPGPTVRPTPGPTIGPGATVPPFAPANIGILWDALKIINEHWVRRDQLNPTDLTYGAANGMIDALGDPGHTTFLTPEEVQSEKDALSGTIIGIGVFLGIQGGAPFVQSVVSGSPAAKAGIQAGDRIIAVDGTNVENSSIGEIARLVRGPEGTQVTLTVIHPGEATPVSITITRQKITVPAVTWAMLPGTAFADIRIAQFSSGTTEQFTTALRGARQAGARGIVLDLRNNPGGFVDDAVGVSSQLLASGDVYIRRTSDGTQIPVTVQSGGIATDLPLVVLVDYGSASSAEITAGAIQDNGRGPLVGVRTYGTGTVLNTFNLPDGSAIRLGVEEWLTPKGRAIFPDGIQPDQEVELPYGITPVEPDEARTMTSAQLQASGDAQLLRAIQDLATR